MPQILQDHLLHFPQLVVVLPKKSLFSSSVSYLLHAPFKGLKGTDQFFKLHGFKIFCYSNSSSLISEPLWLLNTFCMSFSLGIFSHKINYSLEMSLILAWYCLTISFSSILRFSNLEISSSILYSHTAVVPSNSTCSI